MEDKKKNTIIVSLVVIIIILLLALVYFIFLRDGEIHNVDNKTNSGSNIKYENTFKYDKNSYGVGVAYAKGYAKVEKKDSCLFEEFCTEDQIGKEFYDVVYFYITNTESEDLKNAIKDQNNGEFGNYIQLGCVVDDAVKLYSLADRYYSSSNTGIDNRNLYDNYWGSFSLNKTDTQKLISSNEKNQVTLKLEKYQYSIGGGPGVICYSPINSIEIVD